MLMDSAKAAGSIYNYPKEIYGRKLFWGTYSQLSISGGNERTMFYIYPVVSIMKKTVLPGIRGFNAVAAG